MATKGPHIVADRRSSKRELVGEILKRNYRQGRQNIFKSTFFVTGHRRKGGGLTTKINSTLKIVLELVRKNIVSLVYTNDHLVGHQPA